MNEPSREKQLEAILHGYLQAVDAGQNPVRDELLRLHPDLADELRAFFADQAHMDRVAESIRQAEVGDMTIGMDETLSDANALSRIRYFGDYEILEEIARGGMGVVYKARQVSLNRVVALKMILAGQLASETDVRRFRAEAEAAANLDHPNILPIYEVGQHHGRHYFSMKLVTGGSLSDRMLELRGDPRVAVALLVQVTRAVHFAHQRGVLHRDLKPGNVLLDSLTPYVADFGLAKRVEGDSSLTAPGAVVGSPSYMPPEQARAEKVLTVAADVYSLGAILYEMLTGRPPFRGASHMETLLAVLEQEPRPPRQLNSAIARDLETVCLKCLCKEPAGRYATAGDLADDLERWLDGEAVSVNPPTRAERLARWGQKNPVQMALLIALPSGYAAAIIYAATKDGTPAGAAAVVILGSLLALFIGFLMLRGESELSRLEKRVRRENLAIAAVAPATAAPLASAITVLPIDAVPRREQLRILGRGAMNGTFIGIGTAVGLIFLPWVAAAQIRGQEASVDITLWPVVATAVVIVAMLTGAVMAVLSRIVLRPFGLIAWELAWLVAGIAVLFGSVAVRQYVELPALKWWQQITLVMCAASPVYIDWFKRYNLRMHQQAEAAGKLSAEKAAIFKRIFAPTDYAVANLPVLLMIVGVIVGHFIGAEVGSLTFPEEIAQLGADFGALVGRVIGALAGAALAVVLLRLYRVEVGIPWPGQGRRPYPRALAALYLLASAALAAACFL